MKLRFVISEKVGKVAVEHVRELELESDAAVPEIVDELRGLIAEVDADLLPHRPTGWTRPQ